MTAPPDAATSRRHLDRHLVSGVAWTAAGKWGSQLVSWVALLVLAKLLSPSDFGLLGMTGVYLGLITLLSECGIDSAIIVMRDLPLIVIRQLHTVSVVFGIAGSLLALLVASPIAAFFRAPELLHVIPVMGLGFTLSGFRLVDQSLLLKELRFRLVSAVDAAQVILQAIAAVALAWWGMRYWSLILSGLLGTLVAAILIFLSRPIGFALPNFGRIRNELSFSRQMLVARLAWYAYSNADFAVAGRVLGEGALGIYTMAWNIASVPVEKFSTLVTRVAPSIFSGVQQSPEETQRYVRVLTEALALITFPLCCGLALVAKPMMMAGFDRRWWSTATPLRYLAWYIGIRCIATLIPVVLTVSRDTKFVLWQSLACAAVFPPAFYYASRWGAGGIAIAWLIVYPVLAAPLFLRLFAKTGLKPIQYLASLKPALTACAVMAAAVLIVDRFASGRSPLIRLSLDVITGAATYLGVILTFHGRRIQLFRQLIFGRGIPVS